MPYTIHWTIYTTLKDAYLSVLYCVLVKSKNYKVYEEMNQWGKARVAGLLWLHGCMYFYSCSCKPGWTDTLWCYTPDFVRTCVPTKTYFTATTTGHVLQQNSDSFAKWRQQPIKVGIYSSTSRPTNHYNRHKELLDCTCTLHHAFCFLCHSYIVYSCYSYIVLIYLYLVYCWVMHNQKEIPCIC